MASIRLGRYEVEEEGLPAVCMRCGEPATIHKKKQFTWYPQWVPVLILAGLLPFVIVAVILTKRMRVAVPFCAQHRHHWLKRGLLLGVSLVVLIGVVIGGAVLVASLEDDIQMRRGNAFGFICFGAILLFLAWIIMAAIVQKNSIRPTEITEHSITLTGVSPAFVEAIKTQRRAQEEPGYEADERRSPERTRPPQSEDFYDPRRPRPPETFRERDR